MIFEVSLFFIEELCVLNIILLPVDSSYEFKQIEYTEGLMEIISFPFSFF